MIEESGERGQSPAPTATPTSDVRTPDLLSHSAASYQAGKGEQILTIHARVLN